MPPCLICPSLHPLQHDWLKALAITDRNRDVKSDWSKIARIRVNAYTTAICSRICTDPCKQAVQEQNSSVQKICPDPYKRGLNVMNPYSVL